MNPAELNVNPNLALNLELNSAMPCRCSRRTKLGSCQSHAQVAPAARLSDYIAIARPDHWIKHVLIVPGVVFAAIMSPAGSIDYASLSSRLIVCLIVAMALSSANYTINEWLDAPFDAMHPTKRARPAVHKKMSATVVFAQYLLLTGIGLSGGADARPRFWHRRHGVFGVRRDL